MEDNGHHTVRLGTKDKPVRLPTSFATLQDILLAFAKNPHRAAYTALGLCVTHKPALGFVYSGDAMDYGGKVMDALHATVAEGGGDFAQVTAAAFECWRLCVAAYLPSESEVQEAEDFSGASVEAPTTSPSSSG